MSYYDKPVADFLKKCGVKYACRKADPQMPPPWHGDRTRKWTGTQWKCSLLRNGIYFRSPLWCGSAHGRAPTSYAFMSRLPMNDPGAFREWLNEFGSEGNAADLLDIWEATGSQWQLISQMFTDEELKVLRKIAQ